MNDHQRALEDLKASARRVADLASEIARQASTSSTSNTRVAGERIRSVRRLRGLDLAVLDAAVVAERLDGSSWEEIASALNMPRDETRRRYAAVVSEWQAGTVPRRDSEG